MKALFYILVLVLLTMLSCTSRLYTGTEFDDLYYLSSDKPVAKTKQSVNEQIAEGSLKEGDYYDNIYATDTLVSDDYSDAVDINNSIINNNNYGGGYDYYDNFSYSGRLRNFYGNYFDPYWRDPYYSSWGFPSFGYGLGYGGFPYSYGYNNPFIWDSYYSYGGYDSYYGGFYPGYYGGYYGSYYGGYGSYSSYYGGYPVSYSRNDGNNSVPYGRRERPSNLSSRWNNNVSSLGSSRRDTYLSSGGNTGLGRRISSGTSGGQTLATDQRRTNSSNINSRQAIGSADRKYGQDATKSDNSRSSASAQRSAVNMRPEYNSANRSYTPSYNNPRMSTRPSYNNSRVSEGVSSGFNRNNGVINNGRINNNTGSRTQTDQSSIQNSYNNVRNNSSDITFQRRSASPSGYSAPAVESRSSSPRSSGTYSVPTRSSVESRSSYSSGSYNNSSSSGSRSSSSSYSGGSSGSVSSGSVSSGSSSSSSGSSSSSSSGGHRR